MNTLSFATGIITYRVNDACNISFNPTDSAFIERLYTAFEVLERKQESYKSDIMSREKPQDILAFSQERDAEMRKIIDGVFGDGISSQLFGDMNVYSLANGLPVWCNFLLAVMDESNSAFEREQKATNPKLAKYLKKYNK